VEAPRNRKPADEPADEDDRDLAEAGRPGEREDGGGDGHGDAGSVGRELGGHAPDGVGDHGDGDDLEPAQPAGVADVADRGHAPRERDEGDGGREREAEPCGERPGDAGAGVPDGDADLAAGRSG
jgi:hypothetical protein